MARNPTTIWSWITGPYDPLYKLIGALSLMSLLHLAGAWFSGGAFGASRGETCHGLASRVAANDDLGVIAASAELSDEPACDRAQELLARSTMRELLRLTRVGRIDQARALVRNYVGDPSTGGTTLLTENAK